MRAVVYLRVSTEQQAEKFSLPAQRRACLELVEKKQWTLVCDPLVDDVSGRTDERRGLKQAIDLVQRHQVDVVIVHNLDRFMRNLRLLLNFKYELDHHRVRLISVLDSIDTSTPEGVLQFQIKGAIAEWYSNNLGRETSKGLNEQADQGLWVGPVPLGYVRGDAGQLIVDEQGAYAVRFIFERYASGVGSYTTIADECNRLGLRTRDGTTFGREAIRTILRNRAYLGEVSCSRKRRSGQHEPLVTPELFARCQELRQSRSKGTTANAEHTASEAWLTGYLFCEDCGRKFWHSTGGKRSNVRRYRCSGHEHRVHPDAQHVSARMLENQMLAVFAAMTLPAETRASVVQEAQRLLAAEYGINRRIDPAQIEAQIERLAEAYADGALSRERYQQKLAELRNQLNTGERVERPRTLDESAAMALLSNVGTVAATASAAERRELMAAVVTKVWIQERRIVGISPRAELYPLLLAACAAHTSGGCVERVSDGARTHNPLIHRCGVTALAA